MIRPYKDDRAEVMALVRRALGGEPRATLPLSFAPVERAAPTWNDFAEALAEAKGEFLGEVERAALAGAVSAVAHGVCGFAHGAARLLGAEATAADVAELNGLTWMVATGFAAIARAGAVAVDSHSVPTRIHLLLPENLLLLVPADALVADLPDFYSGIAPATLAGGYLTLIGGPSRTADIEQTLITGAHGPRRLAVLSYRG